MIAWAVVRAMEKHAPFRRIMLEDDSIVEHAEFDLGIAVSLENDRLATAVVTKANTRDWPDFVKRYNETVEETRTGRVDAVNAPIVISSLGAFGVRAAAPIVVPPSVGTLFVGSAHQEMMATAKKAEPTEVITLSLTFDHRVVNGAGAASFVHDIKEEIESFQVPAQPRRRRIGKGRRGGIRRCEQPVTRSAKTWRGIRSLEQDPARNHAASLRCSLPP